MKAARAGLDDLQIVPLGDGYNRRHPPARHLRRRGVLPRRRQAQHLRPMPPAGRLQRFGADALVVHLQSDHLGARCTGGIAKTGIGQLLGQHHRPVAAQAAIEDQADGVLPAMGQHDVSRAKGPQHAVGQPVAHSLAQRLFLRLARIIKPLRRVLH